MGEPWVSGLTFGYGVIGASRIEEAVGRVAQVLREAGAGRRNGGAWTCGSNQPADARASSASLRG
jgi:hypothetical protein